MRFFDLTVMVITILLPTMGLSAFQNPSKIERQLGSDEKIVKCEMIFSSQSQGEIKCIKNSMVDREAAYWPSCDRVVELDNKSYCVVKI